jgi:hypothetical protein
MELNTNNYLKDKTAYLCGCIHAVADDGVEWRSMITPRLEALGIKVSDPCKKTTATVTDEVGEDKKFFRKLINQEKWEDVKKEFWPIVRYDLREVDKSDFLIFNYDTSVPMVGSVHELVVATMEKKVILLKYDREQLDFFNPWICTFIKPHHFFHYWPDMIDYLKDVNHGKIDTSYWVL